MITILHGDHIDASRKVLQKYKEPQKGVELRVISGRQLDDNTLVQTLESSSLFSDSTRVIIEQLFSSLSKQQKRIEKVCSVLKNNAKQNIVLWEDKKISPSVIRLLGADISVQEFALPVLIFKFLDAIRPGNAPAVLSLYNDLIENEAPELIFSMLSGRFRTLIMLSDHAHPKNMQSWQIQRLTMQSKSFTMEQLMTCYSALHAIEVTNRSGNSPFSVSEQLELFLASI